jgi:hypothetical protein
MRGITITFAVPVSMTDEQERRLYKLMEEVAKANEPTGFVHWLSGGSWGQMLISAADATLLGTNAGRVVDSGIASGEEPMYVDDNILYLETVCRVMSDKEKVRRNVRRVAVATGRSKAVWPTAARADGIIRRLWGLLRSKRHANRSKHSGSNS